MLHALPGAEVERAGKGSAPPKTYQVERAGKPQSKHFTCFLCSKNNPTEGSGVLIVNALPSKSPVPALWFLNN